MSEDRNEIKMPPRRRAAAGFGGGPHGMMPGEKPKNFKKSIGKLIRSLRPYAFLVFIAVLFTSAATVLAILAPTYVGKLTDEIAVSAGIYPDGFGPPSAINMSQVAKFGTVLAIFYASSFLLNYVQAFIMAGVNQGVSKGFRTRISKKINKLPLKYFDGHALGDTLSRVTNDVDTIGQTLNQSVSTLISSVIMLIGVIIAMFVTAWPLALVVIATVPLGFAAMGIIIKFTQKYFREQARELGALNGQIEEVFSGHNVVKAFNAAAGAEKSFDETNQKLFQNTRKAQFLSGLMMPLMGFVGNLGYVAVCAVGAALLINHNPAIASIGVITSFFVYARLFQSPLGQIAQAANMLQNAAAATERVFDFLEEPEQADEADKPKTLPQVSGKVEFKNVRFGYNPDKIIIKDFSANVEPGQKVAIVGPTGAGKTTMVNLLMRFYELNGGEILIDGVPINKMRREDVRAMFGMVLQDTWLFEGSIRENIAYAKENVSDDEVINACKAANIDYFIHTLPGGYGMRLDDDVNISGGQRQLMTIARAMVQNSPMLILDEATSNVDTRTEQLIQDAMDKVTKGRTSFVIAHRLSTVKNADLILVMKDGDVIESGNHADLISQNGFYAELYNSQFNLNAA